MKNKLLSIINEFGEQLTKPAYNQYVTKLRDYLIPYILQNKDYEVDTIFKDEFTKSDLINATIYYIKENPNVRSISAIDDYLIAMNRLFEQLLFDRYPNPTLMKCRPFTSLSSDVQKKLDQEGIDDLLKREVNPSIDVDQFEFILQYLNDYKIQRIKSYQVKIIIKLFLLYGFSYDKMVKFKIGDYHSNQKTLQVEQYKQVLSRNILLKLPNSLAMEIDEYLKKFRSDKEDSYFLFITERNNKIFHGFISDILNSIKDEYFEIRKVVSLKKNQFTPTGLQKYAIIQMILCGMNQSIIMELTGQKEDIYNDCQNEVNITKELNRSRYINDRIKDISTFDAIERSDYYGI